MRERLYRNRAASPILRLLFFAGLWSVLTGAARNSWTIGIPTVIFAAVSSVVFMPPTTIVWLELFRFVPFFLWRSLLGGLDVARRTMQPTLPIAPALVSYRLRLPPGLPQVLMLNTVSLLPGTLAADVKDDCAILHLLDATSPWRKDIQAVERRVARLFGVPLKPEQEAEE